MLLKPIPFPHLWLIGDPFMLPRDLGIFIKGSMEEGRGRNTGSYWLGSASLD